MTTSDTSARDALVLAMTDVIRGATSPEIQSAQAMLLRRLATQGDVIPSRIPAPLNISEVGGYFNLLTTLDEQRMRREMLGSALGLASGVPIDVGDTPPPMTLTRLATQRPDTDAGASVPLSVGVRADVAPGLSAALTAVAADGGMLPLWSPPPVLPGPTAGDPSPLPWLGRELWVAPSVAAVDPEHDPVILGRASGDAPGYRLGIRVADGTAGAPTLDWTGLAWDAPSGSFVERVLGATPALPIETALAGTAFRAHRIGVAPASRADLAWARLTAPAGLVPGVSRLGDELALLWTTAQVAASAFAPHLDRLWDGTAFVG